MPTSATAARRPPGADHGPVPSSPGPFVLHTLRGGGATRINQDLRARELTLNDAHAYDQAFHAATHRPPLPRPAEPGPFDTRTAKIVCDDVKMAAASYRAAAEHYDNAAYWNAMRHERMGSNTADHLRAEALRELDVIVEPLPPLGRPGITNRGGEAMRPDTRGAARRAASPEPGAGVGGAAGLSRAIGAGHSVPAWDAYTTVTAPFATAALVHAPERDVAARVLEATQARGLGASTFYVSGSLSSARAASALRVPATTTGGFSAAVDADAGPTSGPSVTVPARVPPGGFSSTLEIALRTSARDVARSSTLSSTSTSSPAPDRSLPSSSRTAPVSSRARSGAVASKGARIDLRDEHALHALVVQQTAAHSNDAQRHLLLARGLPLAGFVDVVEGGGTVALSAASHAGQVRAVATAQGHGADFERTAHVEAGAWSDHGRGQGDSQGHRQDIGSPRHTHRWASESDRDGPGSARHNHREHHVPSRRHDAYGNVGRADVDLPPQWVSHTARAESEASMLSAAGDVPVEPTRSRKFLGATAQLGGYAREAAERGEGERRLRLRVWAGSSAQYDATAAGTASTVLDDSQWQKIFYARAHSARGGSRVPGDGDGESGSGGGSSSQGQGHGDDLLAGGASLEAFATTGQHSFPPPHQQGSDLGPTPPSSAASGEQTSQARAQQQQQRQERASAAPSVADDLRRLLNDTEMIGPAGRRPPLPVDRAAALRSRGASRQRVREVEDEQRFPAASAAVDADAARELVDSAVAASHPFLARQRSVEHARELQGRCANMPRAKAVAGALSARSATGADAAVAAAVQRGPGGTTTVLLEAGAFATEHARVPHGRALGDGTVRRTGAPHRATVVEALSASVLAGGALPSPSQDVPSALRTSRGFVRSGDAPALVATRAVRTSHSRGTGAGANHHGTQTRGGAEAEAAEAHGGWTQYMTKGAKVALASTFGPGQGAGLTRDARGGTDASGFRPAVQLGALQQEIEYAFPFKVRNQTPFSRSFRVVAAGLDDAPSAPRGTLHVRARNVPVAAGLSFTCVIVVRGMEPGHMRGHVHIATDDGQHFALALGAYVLEPALFARARDEARATGRPGLLRELIVRMDVISREWDGEYAGQGPVEARTLLALRPGMSAAQPAALAGRDAARAEHALRDLRERGPSQLGHAGGGLEEAVAATMLDAADAEADAEAEAAEGDETYGGEVGGRDAEVEEGGSDGEDGAGSARVRRGGLSVIVAADADARHGGGGAGRSASPTASLLRLSAKHGTTPGDLLGRAVEAGLPLRLAGSDADQGDAVVGERGSGEAEGAGDRPLPLPTVTSGIVVAALRDNEPVYIVGDRVVAPMHVGAVEYPEPTEALAVRLAGLQRRDHRDSLRGHVSIGSAGGLALQQRRQELDAEPSLVVSEAGSEYEAAAASDTGAARTGEGSATGVPAGGGGGGSGGGGLGATLMYSTVEPTFSTIYKRPVERVGPQTNKHSPSSRRAQGDAHGRAGQSDIMLRAADFVVPFGGTHALVVPVV